MTGLLDYCRTEGWKGYDPYDGLNSPLARMLPSKGTAGKVARTVWIQMLKRSPINLRPLLGIHKEFNPKGIALAARAVLILARQPNHQSVSIKPEPTGRGDDAERESDLDHELEFLIRSLTGLRSPGYSEWCWGYNFDWQSRAFYAPRGTPNVVCTVFAALAYLEHYERSGRIRMLDTAESSCRWLLDQINRSEDSGGRRNLFCFSYTPHDHSKVHNVNLLAAEALARVYVKTGYDEFAEAAARAAAYSIARQRDDGSWVYGEAQDQQWIDGFHTGFILTSIQNLVEILGSREWIPSLEAGYSFYKENFFLADGRPKYYHDKLYPIDAHSAAVAVVTFVELGRIWPESFAQAEQVMKWTANNLQDPAGFFYYQMNRLHRIKIPYMRWSQAWMLYALAVYFDSAGASKNG